MFQSLKKDTIATFPTRKRHQTKPAMKGENHTVYPDVHGRKSGGGGGGTRPPTIWQVGDISNVPPPHDFEFVKN